MSEIEMIVKCYCKGWQNAYKEFHPIQTNRKQEDLYKEDLKMNPADDFIKKHDIRLLFGVIEK